MIYTDKYFYIYTSINTKKQCTWLYKAPGDGSTKHRYVQNITSCHSKWKSKTLLHA